MELLSSRIPFLFTRLFCSESSVRIVRPIAASVTFVFRLNDKGTSKGAKCILPFFPNFCQLGLCYVSVVSIKSLLFTVSFSFVTFFQEFRVVNQFFLFWQYKYRLTPWEHLILNSSLLKHHF